MSIAVGIDVGFDSHIVAKMTVPTEPTGEPQMEIQKTEGKESEFKCQVEYTDALLKFCDQVPEIDAFNFEAIAKFTAQYFRDTVNTESEKNFSGVSLSKKNGQVYMTFKTKESSKEMSVPAALGLMFLYEFFCVANSGGSSDLLFTTMTQGDWKSYLQSIKSTLSVPAFFTDADVARLKVCLNAFGLPDSSFVTRSIPISLSACYSLWKDAYTKDKMMKRNFAVLDFGATGTSIYLVNFKRHHMKIKCHLHSTEACIRNIELGLADAIRKSNTDHKQLFKNPENCLHAITLAKKYLPQFFNAKTEFVRIVDAEGFKLNGEVVAYDEKIQRKDFLKECKKTKVMEAYTALISLFIDALTQNKIVVDRIIPIGSIINFDDIKTMVLKKFSGHTNDKRLTTPANRAEAVAEGTLLLYHLISTNQAAIDPEFVKRVFWPSAELEQANTKGSQMPGILKIFYTRTGLVEETADGSVLDSLTQEMTDFVNNQVEEEGRRYNLRGDREKLVEDYTRVMKNLTAAKQALEEKEKQAEVEKPEEEKGEEKGEEKSEEKSEEKAEEKPEEKPEEKSEEKAEEKPETENSPVQGKSNEMRALEMEEGELEEINGLIHSDKYLCTTPNSVNTLMERLSECDARIRAVAANLGVAMEERPIEQVPATEQVATTVQKKKKGGCCKSKSDVVEMGPA